MQNHDWFDPLDFMMLYVQDIYFAHRIQQPIQNLQIQIVFDQKYQV